MKKELKIEKTNVSENIWPILYLIYLCLWELKSLKNGTTNLLQYFFNAGFRWQIKIFRDSSL